MKEDVNISISMKEYAPVLGQTESRRQSGGRAK